MQIQTIPINTAAWAIGGLVIYVYCARLWVQYKQTNNMLSWLLFIFFLPLGTGFLALSLPVFFSQDETVVRWAYLVGDAFRLGAVAFMGRVFWFITLRQRVPQAWVFVPALLLVSAGWIHELFAFFPYVEGNLVMLEYPFLSSLAQVLLLALFGLGIGLTFIWQGLKEAVKFNKIDAAIKSVSLGIGFASVPGAVVVNNLINRGGETFASSIVIIAGFVIALMGLELPAVQRALSAKPTESATADAPNIAG